LGEISLGKRILSLDEQLYFGQDFIRGVTRGRWTKYGKGGGVRFFRNQSQEGRIGISSQVEGPMGKHSILIRSNFIRSHKCCRRILEIHLVRGFIRAKTPDCSINFCFFNRSSLVFNFHFQ
jgi:hypothetical protein